MRPLLLKKIVPSWIVHQKLKIAGCILFTFDDGPHPDFTPRILDVLDKYGACGLFFIPSSRIERGPKILKEIIERKHGVGNHSFSHTSNNLQSFRQLVDEIKKCSKDIFSLTGIQTNIYRPPRGIVTLSLLFAAAYCNHRIMRWSIDVGEYSHMRNATPIELANNFMENIHDRAIVVSHDDIETTHKFLEIVLPRLLDMGFDLKTGLSLL